MEDREYKIHEDNKQQEYLNGMDDRDSGLFSCKYLSRKFIHSANAYFYTCSSDTDFDGCPKFRNEGISDIECFTAPHAFLGEDNTERGDFNDK